MSNPHATHQAGMHLVLGEAMRRNLEAERHEHDRRLLRINGKAVQVRARRRGDWQLGDYRTSLLPDAEIIVLVDLEPEDCAAFYVVPRQPLQEAVTRNFETWLATQPDQQRPRNPESRHAVIYQELAEPYRNRWDLF